MSFTPAPPLRGPLIRSRGAFGRHVARGDAAGAIARSKYVISQHFETPWTEHAFLEPECAVAYRDLDGDVMLLTTDQSAHTTLHECSLLLGPKKIKVQNQLGLVLHLDLL